MQLDTPGIRDCKVHYLILPDSLSLDILLMDDTSIMTGCDGYEGRDVAT